MSRFDYRIVQINTETGHQYMPQRGVSGHLDGISAKVYWCDGVPAAAPSLELARAYVESMRSFDGILTPGTVVYDTTKS